MIRSSLLVCFCWVVNDYTKFRAEKTMTARAEEHLLRQGSLAFYRTLFASLSPPTLSSVTGIYQADFVGPSWLRTIAGPGLYPLGLGGWWGKSFDGRGQGSNIICRNGQLSPKMPVTLAERPSAIDGRSCLAVNYPPESPFPWPWVVDELRSLDAKRLLGMTLFASGLLKGVALPFLLSHRPDIQIP